MSHIIRLRLATGQRLVDVDHLPTRCGETFTGRFQMGDAPPGPVGIYIYNPDAHALPGEEIHSQRTADALSAVKWPQGCAWTRKTNGVTERCVGAVEGRHVCGTVATYRIAYGIGATWEAAFADAAQRGK